MNSAADSLVLDTGAPMAGRHGTGDHSAESHVDPVQQLRANRVGLWLFIASESFLFAALVSTRYVIGRLDTPEELNQGLALVITGVLLFSSISAYLAEQAMRYGRRTAFFAYMYLTQALGVVFLIGVVLEWKEMLEFFPPATRYGSIFVTLVGFHAFHVFTGLIALVIVTRLAILGRFDEHDNWGVEAVIKYWHFVDLAWVVIYPTLYLMK